MISRRLFAGSAVACFAPSAWAIVPPPDNPRFNQHPELQTALGHVRSAAWTELAALVARLPPDSACVLLDDLGDQSEVDLDLSALDRSPMALTTRGALLVGWAWRYRGAGWSSSVSEEMGRAFSERLLRARADLEAAITADSNDGIAYTFLFRALKGLSAVDQLTPAWEAFQNAVRKPVRAFSGFADALSAKWFGSDEVMLGFARTHQRALEPASHALICQVANELLMAHLRRGGVEAGGNFAGQQGVLGEVGAANDAYIALPAPDDFYQANFANGQFSFYFSFLGLSDYARPHLQSMGRLVSGPWTLFGDSAFDMLERARTAAGLATT
jgi:hypothetical protein